ncbi:MAG: aspartyl protease family protein [Planctomycetes bacterium]|nr:aspartyl protease family protein [Planctomycetota bacterium]
MRPLARRFAPALALPLLLATTVRTAAAQSLTGEWRMSGTQAGRAVAARLDLAADPAGGFTVQRSFRFTGDPTTYGWSGRGIWASGALHVLFVASRDQVPTRPGFFAPGAGTLRVWGLYQLSGDGRRLSGAWQVDEPSPRWGQDSGERPSGRSSVPYDYFLSTPFVRVELNGSPRTMLFDTGANTTAVDTAAARAIGLAPAGSSTVAGTTGTLAVQNARVDRMRLGAATAANVVVTLQDLSGFLAPRNGPEEGLLGTDFIGRFLVTLAYDRGTITLEPPAPASARGLALPPLGRGSRSVPLPVVNGIPRLALRLDDGIDADFSIDTGLGYEETEAVFLSITEETWNRLRARNPALAPERYFTVRGMGGVVNLPIARIASVSLGGFRVSRPWVVVQPRVGTFAAPGAPGLVGNNFLRRLREVRFDFAGQRLEFRP